MPDPTVTPLSGDSSHRSRSVNSHSGRSQTESDQREIMRLKRNAEPFLDGELFLAEKGGQGQKDLFQMSTERKIRMSRFSMSTTLAAAFWEKGLVPVTQ